MRLKVSVVTVAGLSSQGARHLHLSDQLVDAFAVFRTGRQIDLYPALFAKRVQLFLREAGCSAIRAAGDQHRRCCSGVLLPGLQLLQPEFDAT